MKKRKIWVSIALASACLFSLAACGKTEESTPTPTPTATATPTPTATPTATPSVPSSSVAPTSTYDPTSPLDVCYDVTFDNYIGETVPSTGLKTKNVTLLQTNMSLDGMDVSYDGTTYKRISNIKGSKASPALKVNVPTEGKVTMIIAPQGTSDRTLTVTDGFGNALPVKKNGELVENGILPNGGSNSLFVLEVEVEDTTDICLSATNGYVLLDVKTEFSQIFGELEGIEVVNPGRSQYVVGMDYNPTKLLVKAVYENGEIFLNPDEFTIDTSGYNNSAAGTYTIKVVKDGKEDSFEVTVKSADALELELYSIAKGKNSKANNGQYITTNAKRIYKTSDEKIDTTALIPLAVSGTGADAIKSPLAIDEVSITGYTKGQAGKQTITVSYGSVSASYDIYVVDTEAYKNANNEYIVTVDGSYTGVVGAVDGTNGNMFTTIGQALEFVQDTTRVAASAKKVIKVAAGYYREKLEITAPNLTIEGAGSTKATYNKDQNYNATEFNAATVIEFDSLYGEIEQNGFVQVTDSTQTVSVRDTAENCVIKNLTISNAYNCKEYFDDKIGTTSEHRALAILIQADTFQMYNSSLLGYQDTIELFTGRQYIKDSYISGTTDFIFGTNNTTYFKNCEIHSIYNGSTDGGYINAFKGSNSGDSDYVQYGAIYDGCNFTADSADGRAVGTGDAAKTAIARPWAKYSAVAIINSNLGGHISKAAFANNNTKNQRYVAWGSDGPYPTTETVKYVEYNNDGDGKLTEAVTGMRMLTSTEAENYSKLSVIFGTTNGKVKYTDAWDPTAAPTEDDKTYYTFDNSEKASGTTVKLEDFVLNQESETKTKTVSGMTFDVTDGGSITKRTTDKNQDLVLTTGAKIKFNVAANTMVTISGYYSVDIDVNGSKTKAETFQKFYATATEVVITGGSGTSYFTSIVVNPNETAPEAAKLDEITVANANTKVLLNTPYTLGDTAVVTAHYDDGSYKVLETSEYTVNTDAVHADTAGTYDVVVSFGGKSKTISVQYAESFDTTIRKSVGVTFKGGTYTTSGQGYTVVGLEDAIDASSADVNIANFIIHGAKSNSGNKTNWLAFNTGNTITLTVDRACTLEIGFYANGTTKKASDLVTVKLGDATITTTDTVLNKGAGDIRQYVITGAGTIVITAVANDYLGFVGVNVPKNLAEKKADAIAALEAKYPAATYSKNTSYATVLAAQEEAINNAADDEALSNAETAAEGAMAALKTNEQIDAETVVSIAVTNTPTSVAKDGTPDYTNVVVTATFADNHEAQLASDKYEFSVIDTSTTGDKTVTVTVIGTTVTENFTINVVETVQTYTITYHTTVGTAPEQETDVTALPTTLPQLVDSADVNMFVGWYTSETFTSENRALPGTNLAANADLYAYWVSLTEIKANIASALDNEYPTANYTTYKDEIDAAKAAAVTAITADSITTITEYETAAEAQAEILDAIPTDEQIADATTTYSFATNDSSKAADNFIVWDGTANATSLGALTISGNYHTNSNSFQAENTVTITFTVQDKTAVTFKGFSGYSEYQVDGRYAPDTYTKYYETGQTVTVVVTSGKYFVSIAINPLAKATEAATITGLTLSGTPDSNILVGTDLDLSGLKVKLNYSDNTYVNLTNTDYSVDTTSVNKTSPGTYPVTVTYAGVTPAITKTFNVTYAATVSNVIETNTTFVTGENNTALVAAATDNKIQSASVTVGKFTIDATASGACLRLNGGTNAQFYLGTRIEFTVAAGATVTVTGDTYAWGYKIGSETATERVTSKTYDTETTVVIESTSNDGYIDSIEITFA